MDAKIELSIVQFLARLMIPTGSNDYISKFVNLKHGRELKQWLPRHIIQLGYLFQRRSCWYKTVCVYQRKKIRNPPIVPCTCCILGCVLFNCFCRKMFNEAKFFCGYDLLLALCFEVGCFEFCVWFGWWHSVYLYKVIFILRQAFEWLMWCVRVWFGSVPSTMLKLYTVLFSLLLIEK